MAKTLKTYSILFLLLLPMVAFAQKEVSFVGSANAKQIIMGNHFQVSFTLTNANGEDFQPPIFKNFKKLSGKNVSSQSSNINGQWETSTTYSYFLQPKKTGKLTIGAATISISGKKYKTNPFSVEVLEGSQTPKGTGDDEQEKIFVKAEVNTTVAVPGQQIILDYKVYTAIDVDHYNIVEEPDYSGFFTSVIRRFNGLQSKEVINGTQYTTKILKRLALYPQQTGMTKVEPMKFRVAVPINSNSSRTPFTLIRPTKSYILSTNAIEINVNPLPNPIPTSFSGAVGHYKAAVAMDKTAATTDDAVTLRITVTGDGDIKRVTAPNLTLSDTFEVYDPNVVDEQQLERNGELYGTKTFEYLILPKVPGTYSISPEFSYYDPDSSKFVITHPNTYVLSVMKGQYNANVNVKPVIKEKPKQEIRTIKTALKTRTKSDFVGSALFWAMSIFPFLMLIGGIIYKYIQDNKPEIDWVAEKSKKAQKVAKQRLSLAEKHLKAGDNRSFYSETSKVLLGYAVDKFNIPGSELSKSNVEEKLRQSGAKEEHIARFMALIQTCEKAVFAFGTDSDASQTYRDAVGVIADIEM